MKKSLLLFLILSFGCFQPLSARAEDLPLKIRAFPDQNSVKTGMMFLVHVQAENAGTGTSKEFWSNSCSYEKHWMTDNPGVLIQAWTCEENTLERIALEPGASYEKSIMLYIPKKDKTEPVTFRLGFKPMSEEGDAAEPLWSDPVTINVIVPEDMKETLSEKKAPVEVVPSQKAGPAGALGGADEKKKTGEIPPAVPAANPPRVFQDPGVPLTVGPGQEFSISLGSNPSTGFRWKMTLPPGDKTVMLLGSESVMPKVVMPGAPGVEVFKFKALTLGETQAEFVYERPWETKVTPTRKIFKIVVQKN